MTHDAAIKKVNQLAAEYIKQHPGTTLFLNPAIRLAESDAKDAEVIKAFVPSTYRFPKKHH